jgi:hypothetical protein
MFKNPIAYSQGYDVPRDARGCSARSTELRAVLRLAVGAFGERADASFFGAAARALFTLLFVGLGLFGAWSHYRRDRTSWVYFALLFATLAFGLTFYLNFKYGYTYPGVTREMTEVRERDYFFIVSFSLWGVWAGIGIAALWLWLSERFAAGEARARSSTGAAARCGRRGRRRPCWSSR